MDRVRSDSTEALLAYYRGVAEKAAVGDEPRPDESPAAAPPQPQPQLVVIEAMMRRRGLLHFVYTGEPTRYVACLQEIDLDDPESCVGVTVCCASAHQAPLRAEIKWWTSMALRRLVIVVGGDSLPTRATRTKMSEEFPGVRIEYFTADETRYKMWEAQRTRRVFVFGVRPPFAGPYPTVYEGDPQARALGAVPGDFLCYERVACDGVSPDFHWAEVVTGDALFFETLGAGATAEKIKRGS